jgi:uncharacterized membrane protein
MATGASLYLSWSTALLGSLLIGWGGFNLVEGIVDHHILGVHHVRDDLGAPLGWDLAFLAWGIVFLAGGYALVHRRRSPATQGSATQRPRVSGDRGSR